MTRTRNNPTYAAATPEAMEQRRLFVWRYRVEMGLSADQIRLQLQEQHQITVTRQTVLNDLKAVMARADEELRTQVRGWRASEVARLDRMMTRVERRMERQNVTDSAFDRFMNTLCRISDQRSRLLGLIVQPEPLPDEQGDRIAEMRKAIAAINQGNILAAQATTDAPEGFPSPDEAVTALEGAAP